MAAQFSVLIPSYRRPEELARCLIALSRQHRPADEIVVVHRPDDEESVAVLDRLATTLPQLRPVYVHTPGQVAALNAGLSAIQGALVALTDDDAAPYPDWLARMEAHYLKDPLVGAVGGRDRVHHKEGVEDGERRVVGKMQWFGRLIGNHHLGIGLPREVDVLKGVNMSFRSQLIQEIGFDSRLMGQGAQVHQELALCLALKRAGWKLIYDPAIAVDHYPAVRFDQDQRRSFNRQAQIDKVHNETLILLEHLNAFQRIIYLTWATLVGTKAALGLLQYFRFLGSGRELAAAKLVSSLQGRWEGVKTWQAHRCNTPHFSAEYGQADFALHASAGENEVTSTSDRRRS